MKKIHTTEKEWEGHDLRFTDNIALLELAERIRINAAVYPACLNWGKNESLIPEDGADGQVRAPVIFFGRTMEERRVDRRLRKILGFIVASQGGSKEFRTRRQSADGTDEDVQPSDVSRPYPTGRCEIRESRFFLRGKL